MRSTLTLLLLALTLAIFSSLLTYWYLQSQTSQTQQTAPSPTENLMLTPTTTPGTEDFAGQSTYGPCSANSDCTVSGCSSEICQSKSEESRASICIYYENKKYPKDLGYTCQCLSNKCQWAQ